MDSWGGGGGREGGGLLPGGVHWEISTDSPVPPVHILSMEHLTAIETERENETLYFIDHTAIAT